MAAKHYIPNMSRVRKAARRAGIRSADVRRSTRRNKKVMVFTGKKWAHFGDIRYENYTTHRNNRRRAAYLSRARGMPHPRMSPNWLAIRLLWDG